MRRPLQRARAAHVFVSRLSTDDHFAPIAVQAGGQPRGQPPKPVKAFRAYLLRSLLAPVTAIRWRRYIRALHRDVGAATPPTRVLAKPVRRYVHRGFLAEAASRHCCSSTIAG